MVKDDITNASANHTRCWTIILKSTKSQKINCEQIQQGDPAENYSSSTGKNNKGLNESVMVKIDRKWLNQVMLMRKYIKTQAWGLANRNY